MSYKQSIPLYYESTLEDENVVDKSLLVSEMGGFMHPLDFRNAVEHVDEFDIYGICLDFHCDGTLFDGMVEDFRAYITTGKYTKDTLDITEHLTPEFIKYLEAEMIDRLMREHRGDSLNARIESGESEYESKQEYRAQLRSDLARER